MFKDDEGRRSEDVFVRNLTSTEALKGIELAKFIKRKLNEQFKLVMEKELQVMDNV